MRDIKDRETGVIEEIREVREINLEEMLEARDRRAALQAEILSRGGEGCCLVCLTLNMPGAVKRTPISRMVFDRASADFENLGLYVIEKHLIDEDTGSEALWLLDEEASKVKSLLEEIEEDESNPASRMLDFDVMELTDGAPLKLSREKARRCFICERPAAECARSRRHGAGAVISAADAMLRESCADMLSQAACDALCSELETTPKPGLVDMNNSGAHKDMDADIFRKSAAALKPYFKEAALLGMKSCMMSELRQRGLRAEKEMFAATGGINTHKGLIYSVGLMLAGAGMSLAAGGYYIDNAARLAGEDADAELERAMREASTNGGAAYKKYGAKGARGEAAAGFPSAAYCRGRLRDYEKRWDVNTAAVLALTDVIARLEDTNLLHRGGMEGLDYARHAASEIASMPEESRTDAILEFDLEMIRRNLSPGGSADMLALAFLMESLDEMTGVMH